MNKRNLIIQAAVASAFAVASFSANAGVATGFPLPMAIQAVTGTTSPALIVTGQLAYSTAVPLPVGTSYVYVKLNGGALFAQTAGAAITGGATDTTGTAVAAGALNVANAGSNATVTVGTGTVSADQTYITFPVTVTGQSAPVATTFSYTPGATAALGALSGVPAAVVTGSAALTGTISISSSGTVTGGVAPTGNAQTVDTAANGTLLAFLQGVAFVSQSSGAATFSSSVANGGMVGTGKETTQVNVTTGSGVVFTLPNVNVAASTSLINFGGFYFANETYTVDNATGGAFTMATEYTSGSTATVTGNFAAAGGTGGSVFLSSASNCGTPVGTSVLNSANTVATITALPQLVTATPTYVCMQLNTGNTVPIPSTTPALSVTINPVATVASYTGTGTLYPLTSNGGSVYVRSYIPMAAAGYESFIRVINTGAVTASISAQVISDSTGVTGPSAVVATNLLPGAAVTLNSSQIETPIVAAGGTAVGATSRPRLLITGPTSLTVQSFFLSEANGDFNEVSSGNNVPGTAGQ